MPSPPRAEGLPLVGNALRAFRDPLAFLFRSARRYGDVVDLGVPIKRTLLVSHPELIEQVLVRDHKSYVKDWTTRDLGELLGRGLVTSDGDLWKRQRRLMQPAFHRERVAAYGQVMVQMTERTLDGWAAGQERDIHEEMMKLTREIVATTLFSADVATDARGVGAALEAAVRRYAEIPPGVPLLRRIPTPGKRRFDRGVRQLDALIARLIAERRAGSPDAGDLLSMLVWARGEAGEQMPDRQIRDEVMTLFLAGHETTALALTWTWVLLARHPAVRDRLLRELDEVLGGRAPTPDDLPKLRYTEHVVTESMRLYPPVWVIGREAVAPTTVGDFEVPKGTQIWISQHIVHRDPRYYADPEAFLPERWEDDLARRLPRYAYFPFGGGPRVCIGNAFAMMEATLLLAAIARRFTIALVPGQEITPEASVTLRPKHGVRVVLEERRAPAAPPRGQAA